MILLTGGCGFIGSNLISTLPVPVRVLDLKVGKDCTKMADMEDMLVGCEAVIHLAAASGVEQSVQHPTLALENAISTFNVLEACRRHGVNRMVFASTAGALNGSPASPYAASKAAGEAYCEAYRASYGMAATVLRFANVYGPKSAHKLNAIPNLCRAVLSERPFTLYGSGQQRRDFIHVSDVCAAINKALWAKPGTYNIASGTMTSMQQLVETMSKVAETDIEIAWHPERSGEQHDYTPIFIDKTKAALRFEAEMPLALGLRNTLDWYRSL